MTTSLRIPFASRIRLVTGVRLQAGASAVSALEVMEVITSHGNHRRHCRHLPPANPLITSRRLPLAHRVPMDAQSRSAGHVQQNQIRDARSGDGHRTHCAPRQAMIPVEAHT